jgi:hypothetical protein
MENIITIFFPTEEALKKAQDTYPTGTQLALDSEAIDEYVVGSGPSF